MPMSASTSALLQPPARGSKLSMKTAFLRLASLGKRTIARFGVDGLALLNFANGFAPGESDVRRIVTGAPYGPAPRQKLDVYTAPSSAPRPIAIFLYGGGWTSGYRAGYRFVGQAYAAAGFAVVIPDYRLHPEAPFPAFVEDAAAALRWAIDHAAEIGGDPAQIVLIGHSAGAHIAAMLALDPQWLRGAGVDAAAIRAVAALAGPYDFHPFTDAIAQKVFAHVADPRLTQPIAFAHAGAPPIWLGTGDADIAVKPRNSRALAAALRQCGATAEYREYPGLDHAGIVMALARAFRRKAPILQETVTFLKSHLA